MRSNVASRACKLTDRLPREVGHIGQSLVIEQRLLILFAQPQSFGIFYQLFLSLLVVRFQTLNLLLERNDPRSLFAGRFDFSSQGKYPFANRHFASPMANLLALFFDRLNLTPFVFDLLLNFAKFFDRIFRQIHTGIQGFQAIANAIALHPRLPNLQCSLNRAGFQFPLFASLPQLFDFCLLVLAMGSQFTPTPTAGSVLFQFVPKLFALSQHSRHLPDVCRGRYDLSTGCFELTHDVHQRHAIESTR